MRRASNRAMLLLLVAGAAALRAPSGLRCPRFTGATVLRSSTTEIMMPALSSTMTSGRVVSWLKNVGDKIEAGDPIIVVESDKADMEVESYDEGARRRYLAAVFVGEGEDADVGVPVGVLAETPEEAKAFSAARRGAARGARGAGARGAGDAPSVAVAMPALSSTMTAGTIVSWLKGVGDKVEAGDPVMVVESDKADMEVESFDEGYVAAILVDEGTEAAVGDVVALLAPTEAAIAEVAATARRVSAGARAARASAPPRRPPRPPRPLRATASPRRATRRSPRARRRRPPARHRARAAAPLRRRGRGRAAPAKPSWTPTPGATTATPKAAKLAKSKNLDLAGVAGTGRFGRVTEDDVKKALGIAEPAKPKLVPAGGPAPPPAGVVDMTGMQKAIAKNMEATLAAPVFRVSKTVRTDAFDALYQKLKPDGVTVSALLAKAVAGALVKTPLMNAKYEPGAFSYNGDVNVAMAVALDGGLITPTLRNADQLSLADLSAEWKSLVGKAKSGSLKPEEYTTGTFTISNLGMFDVAQFDAILPPGQGAILAISSSKNVVVPMPGSLLGVGIEKQMTVTV
ncbi:dihydrolipoyllysine-residue acetyltransferase [Aureococcus anophagefferens]|nr:dihydrolipoyllysine-residue acetyltransferase [Aureococcus anophagefferens]